MATAKNVAKYLIYLKDSDQGDYSISNLKLQKLLYYCLGFHFSLNNENIQELFPEDFEAWRLGPVVPDVYHDFKSFGSSDIEIANLNLRDLDLTDEEAETIHQVWEVLKPISASELVNMTHEEEPWLNAWNGGIQAIEHEAIREYFLANY